MTRPATLAAAVDRIRGGVHYSVAIPEFLDTFYLSDDADERVALMRDEPPLTGDARLDALAGAICEYLTKRYELPVMAKWPADPVRVLAEPWFTTQSDDPGMREYLTFSSPADLSTTTFSRRRFRFGGHPNIQHGNPDSRKPPGGCSPAALCCITDPTHRRVGEIVRVGLRVPTMCIRSAGK
jgi:hypothetical protein